MSKSILLSIQPKWCELIASGRKTIEVRKTRPKLETPFKVHVYCTKDRRNTFYHSDALMVPYNYVDDHSHNLFGKSLNGKVIGEFICDRINHIAITGILDEYGFQIENGGVILPEVSCLTIRQFADYLGAEIGYGWHISDFRLYDKPRELGEFSLNRPPQSWQYVEGER